MPRVSSSSEQDVQQLIAAYQTLDVDLHASPIVIRTRYHELAQLHHPDKWQHGSSEQAAAEERMREINAAYDLIEDAPLQHRREEQSGPVEEAPPREARQHQRHWLTDGDVLESSFRGLFGALVGASFAYWLGRRGVIQNQMFFWLVPLMIGFVFARPSQGTIRRLEETIWFLRIFGR